MHGGGGGGGGVAEGVAVVRACPGGITTARDQGSWQEVAEAESEE